MCRRKRKDDTDVSVEGQARLWGLEADKEGLQAPDNAATPKPSIRRQAKGPGAAAGGLSAGLSPEWSGFSRIRQMRGVDQYTALGPRLAVRAGGVKRDARGDLFGAAGEGGQGRRAGWHCFALC